MVPRHDTMMLTPCGLHSVDSGQPPEHSGWKEGGKSGRNRPNKELKQVQGLTSVCKSVRQRLWQDLKALSPN